MAVQLLDQWLEKEQERLCQVYEDLNAVSFKEPDIIFLGDSMVEYYPLGELLETSKQMVNRGIRGYSTDKLVENFERLLAGTCLDKIVILIGTNDIGKGIPTSETVENLERIFQTVFQTYPLVEIYLVSVLPVHEGTAYQTTVHIRNNQAIQHLNQAYQDLAQSFVQVHYLDVYNHFLDENGQLKPNFTTDGLHLTVAGYVELSRLLQKYL
ncbi:SGNH/GDSL hydrolase family protein [Streptococcus himalayensis]|uniref:1-alkyl-2-acetylglycerophosphocholine esterase n=1 Tax=Streptococcus himalayensis TaxID=1888195 RepID=A0A917A711_9STRE|nr:SGNH/GDSL hydrolase family protein [Streptococcus himalayensis]GGE32153.1 1-alkyl-2-acetylglycerophosphocholine esterase [Streptococcus himalayensis]